MKKVICKTIHDEIYRLTCYIGFDNISDISYTYNEKRFDATKPIDEIPTFDVVELNIEIKLKK